MNIRIVQGHYAEVGGDDVVVVIDVLRAFTLTTYLQRYVSSPIYLCRTKEAAFELKSRLNDPVLLGEVKGVPIDGFDYGNSPHELTQNPPPPRATPVLRTTNGVESVLNVLGAAHVYVGALVNANALCHHLSRRHANDNIVLMATDRRHSDEDLACAEYLKDCLEGLETDTDLIKQRIANSLNGQRFRDPSQIAFDARDVDMACEILPVETVLRVEQRGNDVVLVEEAVND